MSNHLIEQQYSSAIASAQCAEQLDLIATNFQSALVGTAAPEAIRKTGLQIESDGSQFGLVAKAHGVTLHGRYSHVWIAQGDAKALGAQICFHRVAHDATESGEALYSIAFDKLGNARLGKEQRFGYNINVGSPEFLEVVRKVSIALLTIIHAALPVIERN